MQDVDCTREVSSSKPHICCDDVCGLAAVGNPAASEVRYALVLAETLRAAVPGFDPRAVIDTSRNGRPTEAQCGATCNARGAGCGELATVRTAAPAVIDAYFWLTTPGESDGCSEPSCVHFKPACGAESALGTRGAEPAAPAAGTWYDFGAKALASNSGYV